MVGHCVWQDPPSKSPNEIGQNTRLVRLKLVDAVSGTPKVLLKVSPVESAMILRSLTLAVAIILACPISASEGHPANDGRNDPVATSYKVANLSIAKRTLRMSRKFNLLKRVGFCDDNVCAPRGCGCGGEYPDDCCESCYIPPGKSRSPSNDLTACAYGKPTQSISNEDDNPFELLMQYLDGTSDRLSSNEILSSA